MIYPYQCDGCDTYIEQIKPVSQHTSVITCACGENMYQIYSIAKPIVDNMQAEYYPSLGTVVKSKQHRRELMKARGLVEVGNESVSKVHQEMDRQKQFRRKKYEV